ncbi:hypothetical protein Acr_28g0007880 [Actinidia rufa]|uniref:Transposase (putative) gypsy type domain-containing protein n=1 Tax=Actinidia rufa TaxID=165716 RepID=A0A7J0HAE5_9ERIC|nr:hypothetical protein Acr_28g0007880 [Actinidia rufa]
MFNVFFAYLRMMGERPLYRSKLEIRVEIFRRDFRTIQLRKCIPDSGGIRWRFQVFYLAQGRGGDSTLALGELMSTPMVALASSVEMTWRGSMDSFYLGQEGSEISNLWGDNGRPVLIWRGHVALQTDTLAGALNADMAARLAGLPDEGETITSTRPGEVAFYEAAFPAGLRFPVHNTIRLILQFYNICPAQLVPNAWRSIACSMALWRVYRRGTRKFCSEDTPATLRGGRASSFLSPVMNGRFLRKSLGKALQEFRGRGGFQISTATILLGFFDDEMKVFEEIFRSVEESGRFSVPVLLDSKSFRRVFASPGSRASRTAGNHTPSGEAVSSSSDVGESRNPHEQARRESPSRDDSIVCLGSFRTELRRLLPHIPDLTLLRWTGEKVLDPILGNYLNVLSSNPSLESCSDSSQPVELESDAMSKRVSFKKIGEKLEKAASASSGTPAPAKGVVIGEKRAGESITSSPSKKAKADDGSKGKGVDIGPEGKKKASSVSKNFGCSNCRSFTPRGRDLGSSRRCSGLRAFNLGQPVCRREAAAGGIFWGAYNSPNREAGEQASLQEGRVASMEAEVARLQKLAADFEQQLAESRAREQQSLDELVKAKGDRDSLADHLGKSGALVNELREALNKARESVVEEFKSSSGFMVAVEDAASKYFGEGLNFCKVQLRRHHPDLAIDLEGTAVDQGLLAELDEAEEENDKEKTASTRGVKNNDPRCN